MGIYEMADEILQKTNDGNELNPNSLYLVQEMINGHLNDRGKEAFLKLHEAISSGTYVKTWFHGIKNLTIDHNGYVYWRGKVVEHYKLRWAYSDKAKKGAEELAKRCELLESLDEPISSRTVICRYEKIIMKHGITVEERPGCI
jgi:hypothetical protein